MLGHHWHARETQFKWRFAGGPLVIFGSSHKLKKQQQKKTVKVRLPLTKHFGSTHDLHSSTTTVLQTTPGSKMDMHKSQKFQNNLVQDNFLYHLLSLHL